MKTIKDAANYRLGSPPFRVMDLMTRFPHEPRASVTAMLRKVGPFIPERDAYPFTNSGWEITEEDARTIRKRYEVLVDPVSVLGIGTVRKALEDIRIDVGVSTVALPLVVIDKVINEVNDEIRSRLLDAVISNIPGQYGRCGGMAFSGLDFFLVGWPVDRFNVKPSSGELRQYIWNRLLQSLELNAATFLEWVMILHVLPVISPIASGAIGAAAGSVGGSLGAAIGAFIAGREDILDLGGGDALLNKVKENVSRLRNILEGEAAWPIGFVYGSSFNPTDQHQVLAVKLRDNGNNRYVLSIWDNNHGAIGAELVLDLSGSELNVSSDDEKYRSIKGVICEEYSFKVPPSSLKI